MTAKFSSATDTGNWSTDEYHRAAADTDGTNIRTWSIARIKGAPDVHVGQLAKAVRLNHRSGLWSVTYGFDVVTIGTNDKRSIVVRVINHADAWRPIVLSSCPQGGLVERPHLRTVLGGKRDVHRLLRTITGTEPELWSFLAAESRPSPDFHDERDAQWLQRCGEERLACCIVADGEADVVQDHFARPRL